MSRYKKLFKEMVSKNEDLFANFKRIHEEFEKTNGDNRKEFNEVGEKVVEQIREYVDDLCRTSEGAGYATSRLADKFWSEVRIEFPLIDDVGVE